MGFWYTYEHSRGRGKIFLRTTQAFSTNCTLQMTEIVTRLIYWIKEVYGWVLHMVSSSGDSLKQDQIHTDFTFSTLEMSFLFL